MYYNFEHKTQIRVRYGETDQMGYCYYGNYAQFFEVGRVEALREVGCSYKDIEQNGIMLPVSEYSVKYLKPALYDDLLTVSTKITEIKGVKIVFDYTLYNDQMDVISNGKTTLVFVKKDTMRPCPPPKDLLDKLSPYAKK
jgi:acyl-CoA thioester hydrolase